MALMVRRAFKAGLGSDSPEESHESRSAFTGSLMYQKWSKSAVAYRSLHGFGLHGLLERRMSWSFRTCTI